MRQQVVRLDDLGFSQWLPVDNRRFSTEFQVGLQANLDDLSDLTYNVEVTKDLFSKERDQRCTIARVTTTATVTLIGHGLKTGDNVIIFDTNYTNHNPELNLEGSLNVTVVDKDTFTYTVVDTGQTSAIGRIITFVVNQTNISGETLAVTDSTTDPVSAFRLNVTAFTAGAVTLTVLQQG